MLVLSSARHGFSRSDRSNLDSSSIDSSLLGLPIWRSRLVLSSDICFNIVTMFKNLSTRLVFEPFRRFILEDASITPILRLLGHNWRRWSSCFGEIRSIVSTSADEKIISISGQFSTSVNQSRSLFAECHWSEDENNEFDPIRWTSMGTILSQVFSSIASLSIEDESEFSLGWKSSREIRSIFLDVSNFLLDRPSMVHSLSLGIRGRRPCDLSLFLTVCIPCWSSSEQCLESPHEIDLSRCEFVVFFLFNSSGQSWILDVQRSIGASNSIDEHRTTLCLASLRFFLSLSCSNILQHTFTCHERLVRRWWIRITRYPGLFTSSGITCIRFLDNADDATLSSLEFVNSSIRSERMGRS